MAYLSAELKTEHKDNGIKIDDILKYYKSLNNNELTVGVHADKGRKTVLKAQHTEFGSMLPNNTQWYDEPYGWSGTVPPRPIIRMYLYPEMREDINNSYIRSLEIAKNSQMKNGEKIAEETLKLIGEKCAMLQKEQVFLRNYDTSRNPYPQFDPNYNGDKTIQYKGFDMPWISTGETVEAIDYKIRKRGI